MAKGTAPAPCKSSAAAQRGTATLDTFSAGRADEGRLAFQSGPELPEWRGLRWRPRQVRPAVTAGASSILQGHRSAANAYLLVATSRAAAAIREHSPAGCDFARRAGMPWRKPSLTTRCACAARPSRHRRMSAISAGVEQFEASARPPRRSSRRPTSGVSTVLRWRRQAVGCLVELVIAEKVAIPTKVRPFSLRCGIELTSAELSRTVVDYIRTKELLARQADAAGPLGRGFTPSREVNREMRSESRVRPFKRFRLRASRLSL